MKEAGSCWKVTQNPEREADSCRMCIKVGEWTIAVYLYDLCVFSSRKHFLGANVTAVVSSIQALSVALLAKVCSWLIFSVDSLRKSARSTVLRTQHPDLR